MATGAGSAVGTGIAGVTLHARGLGQATTSGGAAAHLRATAAGAVVTTGLVPSGGTRLRHIQIVQVTDRNVIPTAESLVA